MSRRTFFRRAPQSAAAAGATADWRPVEAAAEAVAVRAAAAVEPHVPATILGTAELPFYAPGTRLYELERAGAGAHEYVLGNASLSKFRSLQPRPTDALELNASFGLTLAASTVRDYLTFWLAHLDVAEAGRSRPVSSVDDMPWRGAPGPGDRDLVASCLAPAPVRQFASGSLHVPTAVLRRDRLVQAAFAVTPSGQVAQVEARYVLWTLPVVDDLLTDRAASTPHGIEAGWETCTDFAADPAVAAAFLRALPSGQPLPSRLLSRPLPFMARGRLVAGVYRGPPARGTSAKDDPAGAGLFAIVDGASIRLLDGHSDPVHAACDALPIALADGPAAPLDPHRVCQYAAFFCRMIVGDDGPFHVIEEPCDLNLSRAPETPRTPDGRAHDARVRRREFDALGAAQIAALARPLQVVAADNDHVDVSACMQYGDALFDALLRVRRDGQVQMDADVPAVRAMPIEWSRNTHPYSRRPVVQALRAIARGP